jgi:hypothetical protein
MGCAEIVELHLRFQKGPLLQPATSPQQSVLDAKHAVPIESEITDGSCCSEICVVNAHDPNKRIKREMTTRCHSS